jgi:hypothetical protein
MAHRHPTRAASRFAALVLALTAAAGSTLVSAPPAGAQTPPVLIGPCPVSVTTEPLDYRIVWSFTGNLSGTTQFGNFRAAGSSAVFCGVFPVTGNSYWETALRPSQVVFRTATIPWYGDVAFTTRIVPVGNLRMRYQPGPGNRVAMLDGQFQVRIGFGGQTCTTGPFAAEMMNAGLARTQLLPLVPQAPGENYGKGGFTGGGFAVPTVSPSATCPADYAFLINWVGGLPAAPGASSFDYTLDLRNRL